MRLEKEVTGILEQIRSLAASLEEQTGNKPSEIIAAPNMVRKIKDAIGAEDGFGINEIYVFNLRVREQRLASPGMLYVR